MIEKLFESLDEKVFTDELKTGISDMFNESVETAVEAEVATLTEAHEAKIEELSEQAEAFKEMLKEEAEEKEAELLESIDAYLEKVVEEFAVEAKEQLGDAIVTEKADLMVEAFDAMLLTGGVAVSKIVEAKDETEAETKLGESVEKYDALVEENIALEKENAELIKLGVISELAEGLSIVEVEKFQKLATIVEFTKDEAFTEKLELIKESVKGAKAAEADVNEKILNENAVKTTYSHLV